MAKKKLLTLFFALICASGIFAHDCVVDGIYYNLDKTNMSAIVTYKGKKSYQNTDRYVGTVNIPKQITVGKKDYSVTTIGKWAFSSCTGLTSVTIPNSVKTIGDKAFFQCDGLTSVSIPNSITTIGYSAFLDCSSLPVVDNLRYADTYLIEAVDKTLSTYTIKEGTKWIGDNAFCQCNGLTSITIPNSVTTIGNYAFRDCSGLTSVMIPNSVTTIGESAFENCTYLKTVTLGKSLTDIGCKAFRSDYRIEEITSYAEVTPNVCSSTFDGLSRNISTSMYQKIAFEDIRWILIGMSLILELCRQNLLQQMERSLFHREII